ncbi:MAG: GNAT family N-acetyltransferase [Rhodocyclaceae bacterium]
MAISVSDDAMYTETERGTVRLCRLTECPPDLCSEIHRVCLEAPNYFLSVEGALPDQDGIRMWFSEDELPWGCTAEHHFVYSITLDSGLIGVAHVLAACRDPAQATIGLLLLSERHQGQGLGQIVFDLLARRMRQWGLKSCLIGVVANNIGALAFWRRVGFEEVGEVAPMDGFVDRTIFMEKKLA